MKRLERQALLAVLGVVLALFGCFAGALFVVAASLDAPERATLLELLASRAALVMMFMMAAMGAAVFGLRALFERFVAAPARLLEQAQAALATGAAALPASGDGSLAGGLAPVVNTLLQQRAALQGDVERQVREASMRIEGERNRLATLMSELTQSVVVCNREGQILLYNQRARLQFRAASAGGAVGGGEPIGLGRSIHAVFDRRLVEHALETIAARQRRGMRQASAQLVTVTPAGRLLRAQVAPVRGADGDAAPEDASSLGFVLVLDDITRAIEQDAKRDQLLLGLTEGSRASLANLQAAVEMLDLPDLEPEMHERFLAVIREETQRMSDRLRDAAETATRQSGERWPLEDVLGADLLAAAARHLEATQRLRVAVGEADAELWLRVDSYALLQAMGFLALRLHDEFGVRTLELALSRAGERAQFDLVWTGQPLSTETVMSWQLDPMRTGAEVTPLTVRDVVERHGGEFWFERERMRNRLLFRFLLPLAQPEVMAEAGADSRPEFYDFDLFRATARGNALDERSLSELSYTVFDTETTGLDPSGGDEIIQIGALRIVNGKLLRSEVFEQLVDPQRPLSAASIAVHGITPDMLRGQPLATEVLPAFAAFARDSVLVAHNAAFDMRFLQMKQAACGVQFDQPVLDTLLLSAVVHPNQASHSLEAIAQRLGVPVQGRHTASGDALVTAEVFLKLVTLLAGMGITTLGAARAAAQQTYLARLKY